MGIKTIFMGTPDFASYILEQLLQVSDLEIIAVVTQPDKKVGRKQEVRYSDVKKVALQADIPVVQPVKMRSEVETVLVHQPELIITAAYGQIIPKEILDYPRLGCINVHGSLLPKYRGGAPIQWSIINGEEKTGITIMEMDEKMDAGAIISQDEVPILETDILVDVYEKLKKCGADLLVKTLPSIIDQSYEREVQDESLVTFAYNISREDEQIDFNNPTSAVYNKIRGLNPIPSAYFNYMDKKYQVFECSKKVQKTTAKPGTIVDITKKSINIATQDGIIEILEIKPEGKKTLKVQSYINGSHPFIKGEKVVWK